MQEGEVVLGPPDGALLVVGQVEVLLGDGVQEGSHDMVLVLWGVEDPYWVAVGSDNQQLQQQVKYHYNKVKIYTGETATTNVS